MKRHDPFVNVRPEDLEPIGNPVLPDRWARQGGGRWKRGDLSCLGMLVSPSCVGEKYE